jgi:diguanylate cyclase (GGDEF)-like protein
VTVAPQPPNEAARIAALRRYNILDTPRESAFDDITFLASFIADTPMALVSFIDANRQWFKSKIGLDASESARDTAFCAHTILKPGEVLVVPDATKDERFKDNPNVTGEPGIRFYAGAPLITRDGAALGTVCVIDRKPRELSDRQLAALQALSRQVMAQLELRSALRSVKREVALRKEHETRMEAYQRQLEEANARLEAESITDKLTGVFNRRAFETRLDEEYNRSLREKTPLSLAMIDIDKFKNYNDDFGHQAGDTVLREVAEVLKYHSRAIDIVTRFGGEEFAIILPNTGPDAALVMAERLRKAIEGELWEHRPVTISVGIYTSTDGKTPRSDIIAAADSALYAAKRSGRNRVVQGKLEDIENSKRD